MRAQKKGLNPVRAEILELEKTLAQTRVQMAQAYAGFNAVSDGDLIEAYIYEIQALRARYSYLLRQRKALEAPVPAEIKPPRTFDPEPTERGELSPKVLPIRPALPVA